MRGPILSRGKRKERLCDTPLCCKDCKSNIILFPMAKCMVNENVNLPSRLLLGNKLWKWFAAMGIGEKIEQILPTNSANSNPFKLPKQF